MMTLNDFISFYDFWGKFLFTYLPPYQLFLDAKNAMNGDLSAYVRNFQKFDQIGKKFRKRRRIRMKYCKFQRQGKPNVNLTNYLSCN